MDSQHKARKQKQQLRWLQPHRPGHVGSDASSEGQQSTSPSWNLPSTKVRTVGQSSACEECRKRKKKCNRGRPACSNCVERNVSCEYPTTQPVLPHALQLQRLATAVRDSGPLTDLFSTLPYHEALELFNLLREMPRPDMLALAAQASESGTPATATPVLDDFNSATPSPMSLEVSLLGSLLPSASRPAEVELLVKHPVAYPTLLPIKASLLQLDDLLVPHSLRSTYSTESLDALLTRAGQGCNAQGHQGSVPYGFPSPVGPGEVPRLNAAVEAIALYLHNDYPILPLFDADLFIRDFALHQPYFCSPFLVSALLGWACQAYSAVVPSNASWSTAFFIEAEERWARHQAREALTLCSVSALQFLSMTAATHGRDDTAFEYLENGLNVAKAMGLINVPAGNQTAETWLGDYKDWKRAASYTAWGVFNWTCLFTLRYHKIVVDHPPTIAMPGDVEVAIAAEKGVAIHLPPCERVFRASCQLWSLFFTISTQMYGQGRRDIFGHAGALEFAQSSCRQLLIWANELPLSLVRRPESNHSVFILHTYFHAIVADIARPFIRADSHASHAFRWFGSEDVSPRAVYSASIQQLKRLLLCYRLKFHLERLSVLWQTCLIYVANAAIHGTGDKDEDDPEELHVFLNLCLASLEDLFSSYRVFDDIVKGVLGMGVQQTVVGRHMVQRVFCELEMIGKRYEAEPRDDNRLEETKWVIDLDLALTDLVGAQASTLAAYSEEENRCQDEKA
ncbi:hypothetical protein HJFPF1_02479 [Paramyrothecium foliicola]|nr:hypothetical protein HJFPF1_02479 [Paramyrothecium foliicola]